MSVGILQQALAIEALAAAMHQHARRAQWQQVRRLRGECEALISVYRGLTRAERVPREQHRRITEVLVRIVRLDGEIRRLENPSCARLESLLACGRGAAQWQGRS
jgi:hypothetical protein